MPTHTGSNSGIKKTQKIRRIPIDRLRSLPLYYRETIPKDYIDAMGHMNVRWYMALYDQATWAFFETIGMTSEYLQRCHSGAFALRHFINYFSEIHAGQTAALHTRVLGRTDKRFHFMHFMINETADQVASSFESLGTHADLEQRRSAAFPPFIAEALDVQIQRDRQLDWEAPVCGILNL